MACSDERNHLMRLPAELRNYIYELTLVTNEIAAIEFSTRVGPDYKVQPPVEPPLLHASRRVRTESLAIYYGMTVFSCRSEKGLIQWLKGLGQHKRNLVKSLRIHGMFDEQYVWSNVHTAKLICQENEASFVDHGVGMAPGTLRAASGFDDNLLGAEIANITMPGNHDPSDLRLWVDSNTATIFVTHRKSPVQVLQTLQGHKVGYDRFEVDWSKPAAEGESYAQVTPMHLEPCKKGWYDCSGCICCI